MRGVAHAAAVDPLSAHGRAEPLRDVQLVASDAGRGSPQTQGEKSPREVGPEREPRDLARGIIPVENRAKGKRWLDLLSSHVTRGDGREGACVAVPERTARQRTAEHCEEVTLLLSYPGI